MSPSEGHLKDVTESCPLSRHFEREGLSLTPTHTIPFNLLKIIQIGWNSIHMMDKKFQMIFLMKNGQESE
jgi:hypothetical protein